MDYRSFFVLLGVPVLLKFFGEKLLRLWKQYSSGLPFPPGPPPRIFVGNYAEIPTELSWLTYTDWGKRYGGLVHASALGQHIVIVNSLKTASDLFEKRSHIYSDRPTVPMVELLGWEFNLGFLPYGERWRRQRRMFQQHFRRDIAQTYRPIQIRKVHKLLQELLVRPQEFRELIRTLAAAIIMATVYGYEIQRETNDYFVTLSENAANILVASVLPGALAVNVFPILRHLPGWLPGCGFQQIAAESRVLVEEMKSAPFEFVKQNMVEDAVAKSVVGRLLQASEARGRSDDSIIQEVASVAYGAGSDTVSTSSMQGRNLFSGRNKTVSALATFFLVMALHPDIQKKAQNEIDSIIGTHRLPEYGDRPSLPFVEALYREVQRWRPVLPLGVAHATSEDDIYEELWSDPISGTTVISNTWAMTRDESVYTDPERFNPDRFFTEGKLNNDDVGIAFGFGRRICPGRHAADSTLWATIASILSTFNIAKAKDESGKEIDIDVVYSDGFISHPLAFACSITPRSETAKSLIHATAH
ncbi:cytochrome P450 [Mycena metata]|uniref:Cytochrome P450 n=1 Tax=Mycena metata TaxID=1033252 RepID=A0AAD7JWP8_9AGAR|nr:cytochrome P450 [Mycena metata]